MSGADAKAALLSARTELSRLLDADERGRPDLAVLAINANGDARSYTAISAGGAASEAGEGALSPLPGNRAPAAWKRGSGGAGGPSAPATPTTGGSDADFGHLAALEEKLQALNDTNASVMKQNVALTGELEAAHALARELRNEKAALAVQVRRLLEQQTRKSAAS